MSVTPLTTPFGWSSTAAEVIEGVDLTGRRAIVTGGGSGIGVETARALASAGAEVTIAVRNRDQGLQVASAIEGDVRVGHLDLADLATITAFADAWAGPLDILVNNAGVMAIPDLRHGNAGWELQLATNHLGHFALALGLHDALAAASGGARVVSLSSRGHLVASVDFDDLDFHRRPYDRWVAYGQSKTANVLFAVEANRRWAGDGIAVNAVHPGAIADTNLARYMDPAEMEAARAVYTFKTPEQGAATSVLAAASPLLDDVGGRYFEDGNEAVVVAEPTGTEPGGVAAYALDPGNAERLWDLSLAALV
jgi:NAD(P)-dependent dehydrogenase (short-subunit alcohol dehydrogenase family)